MNGDLLFKIVMIAIDILLFIEIVVIKSNLRIVNRWITKVTEFLESSIDLFWKGVKEGGKSNDRTDEGGHS